MSSSVLNTDTHEIKHKNIYTKTYEHAHAQHMYTQSYMTDSNQNSWKHFKSNYLYTMNGKQILNTK